MKRRSLVHQSRRILIGRLRRFVLFDGIGLVEFTPLELAVLRAQVKAIVSPGFQSAVLEDQQFHKSPAVHQRK